MPACSAGSCPGPMRAGPGRLQTAGLVVISGLGLPPGLLSILPWKRLPDLNLEKLSSQDLATLPALPPTCPWMSLEASDSPNLALRSLLPGAQSAFHWLPGSECDQCHRVAAERPLLCGWRLSALAGLPESARDPELARAESGPCRPPGLLQKLAASLPELQLHRPSSPAKLLPASLPSPRLLPLPGTFLPSPLPG